MTATQLPNFASDNYAGIHPDVLAAIVDANQGPESAYGNDPYTRALQERTRETFGDSAVALPVLTGMVMDVDADLAAAAELALEQLAIRLDRPGLRVSLEG